MARTLALYDDLNPVNPYYAELVSILSTKCTNLRCSHYNQFDRTITSYTFLTPCKINDLWYYTNSSCVKLFNIVNSYLQYEKDNGYITDYTPS